MCLSRQDLKLLFETGDLLSPYSFYRFIDSIFNLQDDLMQKLQK